MTQAINKIDRYKWTSKNEPGELVYLKKDLLKIDHEYQRNLNNNKRTNIARNFDWVAFNVLTVVMRNDGEYYVIDGQHRLAAAMDRIDVQEVPCILFIADDPDTKEEARNFLAINRNRAPLKGIETFKAQVVAGEVAAIKIDRLLSESGLVVGTSSSGRQVACVSSLSKLIQENEAVLLRVWPLILEICSQQSARLESRLIEGMCFAESKMMDETGKRRSLLEADNQRKLLVHGHKNIMREIAETSAYFKVGGAKVWGQGILNLLNHKRQHRLTFSKQEG